jgi:hypothetical protein
MPTLYPDSALAKKSAFSALAHGGKPSYLRRQSLGPKLPPVDPGARVGEHRCRWLVRIQAPFFGCELEDVMGSETLGIREMLLAQNALVGALLIYRLRFSCHVCNFFFGVRMDCGRARWATRGEREGGGGFLRSRRSRGAYAGLRLPVIGAGGFLSILSVGCRTAGVTRLLFVMFR